jgi:hypothetical protein
MEDRGIGEVANSRLQLLAVLSPLVHSSVLRVKRRRLTLSRFLYWFVAPPTTICSEGMRIGSLLSVRIRTGRVPRDVTGYPGTRV